MASIEPEIERVVQAGRTLRQQWDTVHQVWRDAGAAKFEQTAIAPLEQEAVAAVRLLEQLARVLAHVERFTP